LLEKLLVKKPRIYHIAEEKQREKEGVNSSTKCLFNYLIKGRYLGIGALCLSPKTALPLSRIDSRKLWV